MTWSRWRPRLRGRTLSLRLWLVLAVAAITGAGFLAQMGLVAPVAAWERQTEAARIANVRQIIGTDDARWRDPVWQRHSEVALAALGVEVALIAAQPAPSAPLGAAVFMTAGARQFLNTWSAAGSQDAQPVFQRIVIATPTAAPTNQPPIGVALLWEMSSPSGRSMDLLWAGVEWGVVRPRAGGCGVAYWPARPAPAE